MSSNQTNEKVLEDLETHEVAINDKAHSWRICPIGKHYVRTHILHIPPSKEYPEGQVVTRHEHCAENPSHKDMLSYDEIQIIDNTHFLYLFGSPAAGVLKFSKADAFDQQIRGWVRYWNDVFCLEEPLDPNLVKALIASESSFRPEQITPQGNLGKTKRLGYARGLMQIIDATLAIMKDHKGEVGNYFIELTHNEVLDPSANICAGVRWLILKKKTASARLGRVATWDEAVAEYKGLLKGIIENEHPDPQGAMPKFRLYYKQLLEASE